MNSITNHQSVIEREFRTAAEDFLDSVEGRSFEVFKKFFREDLDFKAVLPGGKVFNDVPSFLSSQRDWFDGKTGSFDFRLERTEVSSDLGAAFALVKYSNVDSQNTPFTLNIYISFLFRKVDGEWFLIYDQNTVLEETY